MSNIEAIVEQRCDEYRQRVAELEAQLSENELELAVNRRTMEVAVHLLNTEHGLWASDQPEAYVDAMRDGLDSEEAWKCFRDTIHRLDHKQVLAEIDRVLNSPDPVRVKLEECEGEGMNTDNLEVTYTKDIGDGVMASLDITSRRTVLTLEIDEHEVCLSPESWKIIQDFMKSNLPV